MTCMNLRKTNPVSVVSTLVAAGVLLSSLGGCVPLVVGGAAMAGTGLVVTDRRTTGTQLEDESIEQRAANAVRTNMADRVHVNVTSYNRQVLLTGEAPTAQDKERVEQYVSRVENVRGVVTPSTSCHPPA
jgi:osmotically-inducible protein OsmY